MLVATLAEVDQLDKSHAFLFSPPEEMEVQGALARYSESKHRDPAALEVL